jgi:hypothetical protein
MTNGQNNNLDKYEALIQEFVDQRDAIKKMIVDLENIKSNIEILFPKGIDKRYIRFFEEKVKTMTELFRVILDMRKEIIKNTKDEIELRQKFNGDDDEFDIEGIFNIKKIADRVEKLRKEKLTIEQKTVETIPEKTDIIQNEEIVQAK